MRELLRASSLLALNRFAQIALSIARIKVSALFLERAGIGIVSQLVSMRSLLGQFVSLGMGSGVTKYVAEFGGQRDRERLEALATTVMTGFVVTGVVVVGVAALFSSQIASLTLDNPALGLLVVLTALAIPFTAQYEIANRFLQGLLRIRAMVVLSLVTATVGLAISVPLIVLYGVTGAVVGIVASAIVAFTAGQIFLRRVLRKDWGVDIRLGKVHTDIVTGLLKFGGTASTNLLSTMVAVLVVRSLIIHQYGASANGVYDVAYSVSNRYLAIVSSTVWTFGMPKVASILGQTEEIRKLQNDVLRLSLMVLVPMIVLLLMLREIWIPILYSSAFLGAATLVTWQFMGDAVRSARWAANITNAPHERFGFMVLQSFGNAASWLLFVWYFLPRIGLVAAPMGYLAGQVIMLPVTLVGHWYYDRFNFHLANWGIFLSGLGLVAGTIATVELTGLSVLVRTAIAIPVLAGWLALAIQPSEYRTLMRAGRRRMKRLTGHAAGGS